MSGGWDADGEYVPLGAVDASVEVGHLDDLDPGEQQAAVAMFEQAKVRSLPCLRFRAP